MTIEHIEIEKAPIHNEYQFLTNALLKVDCLVSAAEVHGTFCGLICAGATKQGEAWLENILQVMEPNASQLKHFNRDILHTIYKRSYRQIIGMGFDFELLLPEEDAPLYERARAVGEWCYGFLSGIGFAGRMQKEAFSDELQDTIQRLYDISHINYELLLIDDEDDETAFLEVMEFVRMASLMVYTELVLRIQEDLYGDQSGHLH